MQITLCWLLCVCLGLSCGLKIGAFNIQTYGQTKAGKPEVMELLGKILVRYDIVVIQEIRDIAGTAIVQLLDVVNSIGPHTYDSVISDRLGRTSYKEQYCFFYRTGVGIHVMNSYHYDDKDDDFMREPFVVHFRLDNAVAKDIVMIPIHASPDFAVHEINTLVDVHQDALAKWGIEDVLILGDFNADCSYVRTADWPNIDLWTKTEYYWKIGDDVDTTASTTDCAYDRLVAVGDTLINSIRQGSGMAFRFDDYYGLSYEEGLAVSDHYPVEMEVD